MSQSTRTVTQSYSEDIGGASNSPDKKKSKERLKRGSTQKYILDNTPEFIVDNTLSGLLIKFLKENGPQPFRILEKLVKSEYRNIRKLSGYMYTGDFKRALKGALISNGLFEQVDPQDEGEYNYYRYSDANSSSGSAIKLEAYWSVVQHAADAYLNEKVRQITEKRNSLLSNRGLKFKENSVTDSDNLDVYSLGHSSRHKLDLETLRDTKLDRKKMIYEKLDKYVNRLSKDEEEKTIDSKNDTLNLLTLKVAQADKPGEVLSKNEIPDQLLGAMQVYSFFRDSLLPKNSVDHLGQSLNALSQIINALNSNI